MADVYVNALTTISTEPTTTDSLVAVNRNTNEGKIIDYNKLADVILAKLTSKTFSGLTTTSKLVTGAINELDADVSSLNSNIMIPIKKISKSSSATQSFSAPLASRHFIILAGGNSVTLWIGYAFVAGSNPMPALYELSKGTGVTSVDRVDGQITFNLSTAVSVILIDFVLHGSEIT